MGRLDAFLGKAGRRGKLLRWLMQRQATGFQGRPDKPPDTCYSWWVGASLHMLGFGEMPEWPTVWAFLRECEFAHGALPCASPAPRFARNRRVPCGAGGGFMKEPGSLPDIVHSYFSICGFALGGMSGFGPLNCGLGIAQRHV